MTTQPAGSLTTRSLDLCNNNVVALLVCKLHASRATLINNLYKLLILTLLAQANCRTQGRYSWPRLALAFNLAVSPPNVSASSTISADRTS